MGKQRSNTPFSSEDLKRLAEIVNRLTGNQALEKHHAMLESRLNTHMLKLGIESIDEYWAFYEFNMESENEALSGLMTTHYTFFFREYLHFESLQGWIEDNAEAIKRRFAHSGTPLRVWSAACSKGQEAYSLAMFLEDELVAKHGVDYEILGTDLDEASVAHARNGVYSIREVNTIPQHFLNRFWKKGTGAVKGFAALHPSIRKKTSFRTLNLLDLSSVHSEKPFDVIFARNVFIYFSEENVQKIALGLLKKLNDQGAFVSGVSEPLRFAGWNLSSKAASFYVNTKGATPTVHAPVAPSLGARPPSAGAPASKSAPAPAPTREQSYSVLCVDDSKTIQTLMKKIFTSDPRCTKFVSAFNGQEARQKLDQEKFDLITLDIHMPVMGGIEFLETQYRKNQDPPVIMVSSVNRTDADLAVKALNLGAFDYVEKPAMNKIQQSMDEILTKTRLALRRGSIKAVAAEPEQNFSQSIGQKIVVPDASQSLRWVFSDAAATASFDFIMKALDHEYRSPPFLITTTSSNLAALESQLITMSSRGIERLHSGKSILKPNTIYLCDSSRIEEITETWNKKNVSLQFLCMPDYNIEALRPFKSAQILVDEPLGPELQSALSRLGLGVSDVSPSTSFVSLSLEFFAQLRKAKAA